MVQRKSLTAGCQLTATSREAQSRCCFLASRLESAGEGIANVLVDREQLLTGEGHRSDAHDRNECGDQAIFDGGDAGFVSDETSKQNFHRTFLRADDKKLMLVVYRSQIAIDLARPLKFSLQFI
jgi:hypothetical protein